MGQGLRRLFCDGHDQHSLKSTMCLSLTLSRTWNVRSTVIIIGLKEGPVEDAG